MKFQINVDCTPEEAREFFGLPDILPMQQDLMEQVSRRLSENIQTMEPELLMKTWVPALFQGWTDIQSHFWNQFSQMGGQMGEGYPMDSEAESTQQKKASPKKAAPSSKKNKKK